MGDRHPASKPSLADARLLNHQAWNLRWSQLGQARDMALRALEMTREQTPCEVSQVGLAYRTLAWHARWTNQFEKTLKYCSLAEVRLKETHALDDLAVVVTIRGMIAFCTGDANAAHRFLDQAVALIGPDSRPDVRVNVLAFSILMAQTNGAFDREKAMIAEALSLTKGPCRALIEHRWVRGLMMRGEVVEASSGALRALATARQFENRLVLPFALELVGATYLETDRIDLAERYLSEGRLIARAQNDKRAECHILQKQASLEQKRGDLDAALGLVEEGLVIARMLQYPVWQKVFLRLQAELHESLGNDRLALLALKELMRLVDQTL